MKSLHTTARVAAHPLAEVREKPVQQQEPSTAKTSQCKFKNTYWTALDFRKYAIIELSWIVVLQLLGQEEPPVGWNGMCVCVCVCVLCVLGCIWLFVVPWAVAHQAPLPMEFSKQEYWSGVPFPSPGDFLDPGIEPASLNVYLL